MTRNALALLISFSFSFSLTPAASAHPSHVSVAEIERDQQTNRLEIALRVWPEDLEKTLEARTDRDVDLDSSDGVDELIADYLDETIIVAPPGKKPTRNWRPVPITKTDEQGDTIELPRVIWVGKKFDRRDLWLYFELRLPAGMGSLKDAWISNRLFLGSVPSQENVMQIRDADLRVTLRTESDRLWARIDPSR